MSSSAGRITAEEARHLCYTVVADAGHELANSLRNANLLEGLETRLNAVDCTVELLIFLMFALDLAIHLSCRSHADKIRHLFRETVCEAFRQRGLPYASLSELLALVEERFEEYARLLNGDDPWLRLGNSAWRHIFATEGVDAYGAAICVVHFRGILEAYSSFLGSVEVSE